MEKGVASLRFTDYLKGLVLPDQSRNYTTFTELEIDDKTSSTEVLCDTDLPDATAIKLIGRQILLLEQGPAPLSPQEIRLLNTLHINRGVPLLMTEIQEITGRSKSLIHKALKDLRAKLLAADGTPYIQATSVTRPNSKQQVSRYSLAPEFRIAAARDESTSDLSGKRTEWLQMVMPFYQNNIGLRDVMEPQQRNSLLSFEQMPASLRSVKARRHVIKSGVFYGLFISIDQGIAAYCDTGDVWHPAVQDGIVAWHRAYYSGLGLVSNQLSNFESRLEASKFGERLQLHTMRDDLFQLGAIALWKATMDYAPAKASFPYYAICRINSAFNHAIQSKNLPNTSQATGSQEAILNIDNDGWGSDSFVPVEDNTANIPLRLLHDQLAGFIIHHPLLEPSEKLVLSLYFGIYCNDLCGVVVQTKDNARLTYNESIGKNEVFRDGLSKAQISTIVGLSLTQVKRIWRSGMEKAHDVALTKVFTDMDHENYRGKSPTHELFG